MNTINKLTEAKNICENITETLPEWFGQPDANLKYAEDANKYPSLYIEIDGVKVALLVYKKTFNKTLNKEVIDIHWLGIIPEYHRKGLGSKLFNELFKITKSQGISTVTVETVDPIQNYEPYLKTVKFYKSFGFNVFEHFEDGCKMIRMSKDI